MASALPDSAKVPPGLEPVLPDSAKVTAMPSVSAWLKHLIQLPLLMQNSLQKFLPKGISSFLKLKSFFLTLKASLKCVINFRLVKCL